MRTLGAPFLFEMSRKERCGESCILRKMLYSYLEQIKKSISGFRGTYLRIR